VEEISEEAIVRGCGAIWIQLASWCIFYGQLESLAVHRCQAEGAGADHFQGWRVDGLTATPSAEPQFGALSSGSA
jgi:hypothetical protein